MNAEKIFALLVPKGEVQIANWKITQHKIREMAMFFMLPHLMGLKENFIDNGAVMPCG